MRQFYAILALFSSARRKGKQKSPESFDPGFLALIVLLYEG
jgi:hypothetical protein